MRSVPLGADDEVQALHHCLYRHAKGKDDIKRPEFTDNMRERFLALQPKFELEPMEVLEARFVLENKIDIPIGFEEYKTMRRRPPPAPAPPAPPAWEREGAVSPTGVDYH